MSVFVRTFRGNTLCLDSDVCCNSGENLKRKISELEGIPSPFLHLYHHGQRVCNDDIIVPGATYQALLCLNGGKGGFGSMLRMIGAQIDKTTNHDACRDLSGRRMRDVNNEKKLSDWIGKKAEMEEERKQKREEKLERLRHQPRHIFVDPKYDQQKKEVVDNLDDAISQGIQASASVDTGASTSGTRATKRKAQTSTRGSKRSTTLWMGIEGSESEESDDEERAMEASSDPSYVSTSSRDERDSPSNTSDQEAQPDSQPSKIDVQESEDCKGSSSTEAKHPLLAALPVPGEDSSGSGGDGSNKSTDNENGPLDLANFSSAAELESVGLDSLKSALMALGMKCGGTLQQRAERLFLVKGVKQEMIDPSLLAKPSKGKKSKGK
ncbi:UBL fusion protein SDE2-like [Asterias amurensis]|uniref:UBL fusion protein SDE2-like n=1 Tax=Asterias amurensis TaxID=7602 RepID=UPI003AB3B458